MQIAPLFVEELQTFNMRMDTLRPGFLPGREIDIYLNFVDDGSCNAVAGFADGIGLIGINKGAVIVLTRGLLQDFLSSRHLA